MCGELAQSVGDRSWNLLPLVFRDSILALNISHAFRKEWISRSSFSFRDRSFNRMGSSDSKSFQFNEYPQFFRLGKEADLKEPVKAEISGSFPSWLTGSLYRNGPGVFKMGNDEYKHIFDGFAVIHRWSFKDGQVTYRSSILDSDHYKKCVKYNRLIGDNYGTDFPDPCKSILERFFSYFVPDAKLTDNCMVNIVQHGDKLLTFTETASALEVDGDRMKTDKNLDLKEIISVHQGTAHPHFDSEGNMYYYATNVRDPNKCFNFLKVPPPVDGETPFAKAEVIVSLASRWRFHHGYTHSFGMTENYIIHAEQPTTFSAPKLLTRAMAGRVFERCLTVYPDEKINFVVANRKTGERVPVTCEAPYGFIFHFVNCYEEKDQVVADLFVWDEKESIALQYLDSIVGRITRKEELKCRFQRYVIPLNLDKATPGENLVTLPNSQARAVLRAGGTNVVDLTGDFMCDDPSKHYGEMPRINYDYNTKKYRYCYSCTLLFSTPVGKLYKHDLETRTVTEWVAGEDHNAGEPVFVKNPNGTAEDDGVILSPILANTTEHSSFLVCLDAATFKELGRATVPSDVKMNVTFHGDFYNRFA